MEKKNDGGRMEETEEPGAWVLTPLGCLYAVLKNYAGKDGMLNVNKIQGRYGEHIVDDLFDALEKQGYLERKDDDTDT